MSFYQYGHLPISAVNTANVYLLLRKIGYTAHSIAKLLSCSTIKFVICDASRVMRIA